jgi:chromosome segregation ATPase
MAFGEAAASVEQELADARNALDEARAAVISVDAEIQKKESEIQTTTTIGDRATASLARRADDAESLNNFDGMRTYQAQAAERRAELGDQLNELESQLGALRNRRIEVGAEQTAQEARLNDLKEVAEEQTKRQAISDEQLQRANDLEDRLKRLEGERADLVQQIEQYAPVVEAQREALKTA